jgi:tetratricopeptide (TPR) repeat protein
MLRYIQDTKTPLMKVLTSFVLTLFAFSSYAQELSFSAASEPIQLYAQANKSLTAGDAKNATGIFKQVIEYYEHEGRVKELPESYFGMALAFAFSGHYPESIRFHKKALRAHHRYRRCESDDAIRLNLGLTYQLAGKDRKARKYLPG